MNIFEFRNWLIGDSASYIQSFIQIRDPQIRTYVQQKLQEGVLWPEPLIQLNPFFARGESIDELVAQGILHRECSEIFRKDKTADDEKGRPLRLHLIARQYPPHSLMLPGRSRASSTACGSSSNVSGEMTQSNAIGLGK